MATFSLTNFLLSIIIGSLGVAVILYTDFTDLTDWHGKAFKKSVKTCICPPKDPCTKGFNHGDSQ